MSPDRIRPGSAQGRQDDDLPLGEEPRLESTAEPEEILSEEPGHLDEEVEIAPARRSSRRSQKAADESVDEEELALAIANEPVAHRRLWTRVYYGETRFDFVRRRRIWFIISAVVILAGVISLATRGLNLGIEFVGGTSWTVPAKTAVSTSQVQAAIGSRLSGEVITFLGNTSTNSLTIDVEAKLSKQQTNAQVLNEESSVSNALAKLTHQSVSNVSVESVGPSWGSEITHKAVVALIVFFILIALYISIFFEWRMAFAAIVAVLHDILVTVGIYSLTGLEVTPDTVVAFLTILGYSLYDTIVVFDRVRDNVKNLTLRDRLTYTDVVNASMNQTLARSINTSLVAIMPILAVLVLGAEILGATTLQYFGLALLVGLTTGAYSSIFIASPLVALIKEHEQRYRVIRERLESRGVGPVLLSSTALARGNLVSEYDATLSATRRRARAQARGEGPREGRLRPSGGGAQNGSNSPQESPDGAEATGANAARQRPTPRPRPGRPSPSRPAARTRRKGGRR